MADRHAWIGVLLAVLGAETERVDRRLWQIGVLGSECLDQRSSHHAWIRDRESGSACLDRSAWIGVLLTVLRSETERVDRRLWRISVLGSAFFSPCLDRRSSRRAWIGDRESGSVLVVDRRAWIGVLGLALFSSCLDRCSSRRRAPCLDRNFRKFGIERSENVGIESSYREDSRTESREWKERGSEVEREGLR